jgi:hypothetical protein
MEIKNNSVDQIVRKAPKPVFKPINFLIGFVFISSIFAFIIGGVILGREKSSQQNSTTELKEQIKIKSSDIPNQNNWNTYKISPAKFEFKLPESLAKQGGWQVYEIKGQTGSVVCFSRTKPSAKITKCGDSDIVIQGDSLNFNKPTDAGFGDLQGFTQKNGIYFTKLPNGEDFSLASVKLREMKNENGVEILKILGENYKEGAAKDHPIVGTPGEGYLGAVILTKNSKYPYLTIQIKLNENVSELEFDQMLESLKLEN